MGTPIVKITYGRYKGEFYENTKKIGKKYICYVYLLISGSTSFNTELQSDDPEDIICIFYEHMENKLGLMETKTEYPKMKWQTSQID